MVFEEGAAHLVPSVVLLKWMAPTFPAAVVWSHAKGTRAQPAGFPPPRSSKEHKTSFAPGFDLAFGTVFWLAGRKGRGVPG